MDNIPKQFICPITLTLMSDPYSDSDGNTYEKDAIFQWINQHHTSPITRNPMTTSSLTPNRALKDLINTFLGIGININTALTQSQTQESENDGEDIGRDPVVIIAIADVSGSMDEICGNKNSTEAQNFTRLDLVKHTLNTIVHSLKAQDKLALIKFNNQATAITGIIPVNQTNKTIFLEKIDSLVADGGTNIWDALRCAINQIETNQIKSNVNVNIILFTDGESNENPPRGIIPTLKDYIAKLSGCSGFNFNIHTYGFGNNINSSLLYEISELKSGIFGFIPDSSMIGTVFINSIAKMMDNMASVGCKWSSENEVIYEQFIQALKSKNLSHFTESVKDIQNNEFLNDILIDCNDSINDSDGQIFKALSAKYYDKWGKHYILSVISAYVNRLCLNFRDHGVQHFKSPFFIKFQKQIEDVFINLTPPIPTGNANNFINNGYHQGGGGGRGANVSNNQPVTPQIFSSTFYNSSGVCFATDTLIKIQGGTFIPVQELKKDMQIESMGEIATVICVLKTKINGPIMRMMNNPFTGITPYHPVFMKKYNDQWMFPHDMTDFYEDYVKDEYVYDYILDKHHIVELECGVYATTLNHGCTGDVIGHDYFGTEKIVMELKQHQGWNEGFIQLDDYTFTRDETTNHINGIKF